MTKEQKAAAEIERKKDLKRSAFSLRFWFDKTFFSGFLVRLERLEPG